MIRPHPIVDFGIKQEEQCSPSSVVVSNTTIGNPDNFVWNDSRGLTSTESEPNFPPYTTTDTLVSIYIISLTASNECGTRSLDKEIIVLPPDVEAFIEERDTLVGCQPFALNMESFSTPNASVKWTILNEQNIEITGSNDKVLVDTLQDAGFYMVLLFASQCGTDTDTAYVNVLPQPLVSFETDRPYSCVNDSLQFINTSDQVNEVQWNFGDGTGSTMQSPSHFFDSAGIYFVTLQANSLLNACPASTQQEIEVFDNPVADMTPSVFSGCLPLEVSFLNNSIGENITTYTWNFNDTCGSSFSNDLAPTYVFDCSGQYSVTLEATDARGCSAETSIDNIFVFEPPVANFSIAQESYCLGQDTVRLQNTSSTDAISFQWVVEGDTIAQRNLAYVPTTVGSVEVELIAFNGNGCTASSRQSFEVIASPIAQFTPNITAGCEDLTVQFNNDSQFANNYSWNFSDGNTSSQTNPLNEFLDAGTFRVQLIANSLNACRADTTSLDIEVYPKPLADFDFPVDESCGAPKDVTFSNTSTGQDSDLWMFGDGEQSRQKNPTHRFQTAGQFQTMLMVENRFGCADTIQKTVDIFGQPFADFEFSTLPEGCEDFQISLLNLSTQSLSYIWKVESFEIVEAASPSFTFTEIGQYDVELIAIYNDKCQDTLKMEDAITVHQSPIPSVKYQADFDENEIGEVQFINQSQLSDRYLWDFGDGQSSNLENPLHVYNINRFIDAKLTAYNDNNGAFTCVADTIVPISPEWVTTFYTPNAFAPSYGASEVGVFQPKGLGIQAYEISVYSPFGKLVWHSTALEENSPSEAWNGQYLNEGEDLPQGAYTWFARVTYLSGNTIERTGTVTILR
ncbi:MAG: PKD domain-containing protein [Bacteroidota bacterium]